MAALGRDVIVASTTGSFALLIIMVLGGFVLSRGDLTIEVIRLLISTADVIQILILKTSSFFASEAVPKWWLWGYWISPLMYGQNAITVNEFLGKNWRHVIIYFSQSLCSSTKRKLIEGRMIVINDYVEISLCYRFHLIRQNPWEF